ncbi:MAG: UbiA family prenyltransferase [Gammaproteobacteria bacterium]|nr:UbiA family prenyltransferase [Gammaproteobacteria bacterium]
MNSQQPLARLQQRYLSSRRFLCLCRLHRPADIPLLLLPALWASLLAAEGMPQTGAMLSLLLAALLFRCAAWTFNDWMESRLLPEAPESFVARKIISPREAQLLFATLLLISLLLLLPLGLPLLYYSAVALLLLLGFPLLKTRLLITQPYLGLCYAWIVPMAWSAQGSAPGKGAWLMFTAVLLSATAFNTLYALPRRRYEQRVGIGSVPQLLGNSSWLFILLAQLAAVVALWLAGRQLQLEIFFSLALVVVLLLLPYQQWLLFSHPQHGPMRSYRNQIWSAIAVFCGIAFHFICRG